QIARDRLRADGVRLASPAKQVRATALDHFLEGLTAGDPVLPRHAGYSALDRKLSGWVDAGLGRRTSTRWRLGLHLDEREDEALVLELWLQAEDDPTLGLPASLLWSGDDDVFAFLRDGDPRRDLIRQLSDLDEVLAEIGIEFDAAEPDEAALDPETVRLFLRTGLPLLEERGIPVLLPAAWVRSPARVKVNLTASSQPAHRASGFLSPTELAR